LKTLKQICAFWQCQLIYPTQCACNNTKLCRCTTHKLMIVGGNGFTHSYPRH